MADQQIGVEADGSAGFDQQLFERDRTLRHDSGMLHDQRVARHQMRSGDARELVIGEVPRFDTEDDADRAALHMRLAVRRVELDRREEAFGVLGVIGHDPRTELDFGACFADPLAHLHRHDACEVVGARVEDLPRLGDDPGAIGVRHMAPRLEAGVGGCDLGLERRIAEIGEGLDKRAVERIEALIGHGNEAFRWKNDSPDGLPWGS